MEDVTSHDAEQDDAEQQDAEQVEVVPSTEKVDDEVRVKSPVDEQPKVLVPDDSPIIDDVQIPEFDIENRNGRVYKQKEFMRHFKALKEEISKGCCLGELDHPKEFTTSLKNASHKILDIWIDEEKNCVMGKIKLLSEGQGKIARGLIDDGVDLHISSRAAGTVTEDKSVRVHKLFTYDLVATPGFANARLKGSLQEGVNNRMDENGFIWLNESVYYKPTDVSEVSNLTENTTLLNTKNNS